MYGVDRKNINENNPLPTQVDFLTQERDQLKAELARSLDNSRGGADAECGAGGSGDAEAGATGAGRDGDGEQASS